MSCDHTKKKEQHAAEKLANYLTEYSFPIGGDPGKVYPITADVIRALFRNHWSRVSLLAHQVHADLQEDKTVEEAAKTLGAASEVEFLAMVGHNTTPIPYKPEQETALRLIAKKFLERTGG